MSTSEDHKHSLPPPTEETVKNTTTNEAEATIGEEKKSRPKPPKYHATLPTLLRVAATGVTATIIMAGWAVSFVTQCAAKVITYPFTTKKQRVNICAHIFRRVSYFTAVTLNPCWRSTCLRPVPDLTGHKRIIFMMNHLSNADPWIITGYMLPRESKWICKADLFDVPVGGWALANCGDLKVEFTKEKNGMGVKKGTIGKMMAQAKEYVVDGQIVSVFPEGVRNAFPDGPMGEFKLGFFMLAVEVKATIVPVALSGTERMWPVPELIIDSSRGYVSFGDPITPKEGETPEELRDRVVAVIDAMRNSHPDRKAIILKQQQEAAKSA